MPFTAMDALGVVGLVLLLGAFTANALGRLSPQSRTYQAGNAVGSGLLAVYAWATEAWVFLPLEVVWMVVAGYAFVKRPPHKPIEA